MASGRPSRHLPRWAQRPSPNDSRNGSMSRALTALRESWVNDSSALHGVQRSSPNDSRKGSTSRALTALLESWVNDSRAWAVPTGTPSRANKAPCDAGEQHNNRTQREWCPVLRVPPAAAIGAPGEQKHLPDWITPRQQERTLYNDFGSSEERN